MDRNLIGRYLLILLAAVFPTTLAAQVYVTPTVAPTPPGTLISVNNSMGGSQFYPHVSGDLVCYANFDTNGVFTVHYFDLSKSADAAVPPDPTAQRDYLCDVRGSTIAFTRLTNTDSQIYTFDTSGAGSPAPVSFKANASRGFAEIGDQAIVWQENFSSVPAISSIVAYNRSSGTTQSLSSDTSFNQEPGISADGTVVVWSDCVSVSTCNIWKAILANGTWSAQQLVSQIQGQGPQSHPDTDGTTIVYAAHVVVNGAGASRLVWQPVGGAEEQVLNLPGFSFTPSISGGLIAFINLSGANSDLLLYDVAANVLYNLTADLTAAGLYPSGLDSVLPDISVTLDGKVRVVWQVTTAQSNYNVYAYTFNLPATTSSIGNLIGNLLGAGCIDNGGIANALTSKLFAAQAEIAAGNIQTAINTLTALISQINAQAGKHIATSCTIGGVAFDPVTVLLADVQGLINSLKVSGIADPIAGYVVDANGAGVSGATLSILDAGKNTVTTTTTDVTGFYFFATTGGLVPGSSYTVAVTGFPAGFTTSTPAASLAFTWAGTGMMVGTFVLK
jgi:hypothetical protein